MVDLTPTPLKALVRVNMGQSPTGDSYNSEGVGTPLINGPSEFEGQRLTAVKWTTKPSKFCEAGDVIICVRGNTVGRIALSDGEYCIGRGVAALQSNSSSADSSFVFQLVQSLQLRFLKLANGSTFPNIDSKTISEILVPGFPLPEQRKIAEILRTWDEGLETLIALRTAKAQRLDSLRVALLFGDLRLSGQRQNWEPRRLAEVTHELTARNKGNILGRDSVMGVTKANGIVPMREQTIAADISRYKILPPRAFAYNPMRINVGSIAMNGGKAEVLVSPDYVVFGCDDDGLNPDYLDHLRKTRWWGHYINSGGSGSVRMRTYYDDLAAMKLPLPELDEQREITRILNTARDDLIITAKEIQALNRQKRGLMQKLLTGEWRVKVEAE